MKLLQGSLMLTDRIGRSKKDYRSKSIHLNIETYIYKYSIRINKFIWKQAGEIWLKRRVKTNWNTHCQSNSKEIS